MFEILKPANQLVNRAHSCKLLGYWDAAANDFELAAVKVAEEPDVWPEYSTETLRSEAAKCQNIARLTSALSV